MSQEINKEIAVKTAGRLQREFRKQTLGYILGGLSFVAGLAWNDAIKSVIEYIFPLNKDSMWIKLVYAVILTVIIILITISLTRLLAPSEEDKKE